MTHASNAPPGRGRRLLRWLGHVVLVAAWLVIALMALLTWGPHLTRYKTEIIVGRSMEPTIPLWSVIIVEPVDPDELAAGDVIVAQPAALDGRKVTHRVVEVTTSPDGVPSFQTQGDNNDTIDPWTVSYEDRGWRVVHHVPHVGWAMAKAQTREARLLLVVAPVLLVLFHVLRFIWRDEDEVEAAAPKSPHVQWAYFDESQLDPAPDADTVAPNARIPARGPDNPPPRIVREAPEVPEPGVATATRPIGLHVADPLPPDRQVGHRRVVRAAAIAVPIALVALGAHRGRRRRP